MSISGEANGKPPTTFFKGVRIGIWTSLPDGLRRETYTENGFWRAILRQNRDLAPLAWKVWDLDPRNGEVGFRAMSLYLSRAGVAKNPRTNAARRFTGASVALQVAKRSLPGSPENACVDWWDLSPWFLRVPGNILPTSKKNHQVEASWRFPRFWMSNYLLDNPQNH